MIPFQCSWLVASYSGCLIQKVLPTNNLGARLDALIYSEQPRLLNIVDPLIFDVGGYLDSLKRTLYLANASTRAGSLSELASGGTVSKENWHPHEKAHV